MVTVVNKYKEPNHIYCGRGSALGNPFVMNNESQRDEVCDKYEVWFYTQIELNNPSVISMLSSIARQAALGDVNLGCFCNPKRCHCDTIKAYIEMQLP